MTGVLSEIADMAGAEVALKIAAVAGGRMAYFPMEKNLAPDHWLAVAVGMEAARAISRRYGGGKVMIPLGPGADRFSRIRRIIHAGIKRGLSASRIARLAGVHERTVFNHKARLKKAESGKGGA